MEPVRISLQECIQLRDQGKNVQFLDVRDQPSWDESDLQLPGAVRIRPDELETHIDKIPRDAIVVPYCNTPREVDSTTVARRLKDRGFERVFPLSGGFGNWFASDAPMEPKQAHAERSRFPSQPNMVVESGTGHARTGKGPTGKPRR